MSERLYPELSRAAYVLDEGAFRQNLTRIAEVAARADIEVILALKAFSFWPVFDIVREYLPGATASSLNEAKLVVKHMGVRPHVYAPAYVPREMDEMLSLGEYVTFNSLGELERYRKIWTAAGAKPGLRVNPLYSPVATPLYNPASATGRLGEAMDELPAEPPRGLEGVHVHTLCESPAAVTAKLIGVVEEGLAAWLPRLSWLNLGGGHLMTKDGYDTEALISALRGLRERHPHLRITLEPGSAHAWRSGVLVAHVLDLIENHGRKTAMLDVSFTCHMPDTLEMPYKPVVRGAANVEASVDQAATVYDLGGVSCLAGDYIAGYDFGRELAVGEAVVFEDMHHYTVVKTTMFNGVQHPDLAIERADGRVEVVRSFGFGDYESRMG